MGIDLGIGLDLDKFDDRQLLAKFFQDGDLEAFSAFVVRNSSWALAKARQLAPSAAVDADDAVQDAILRLMDYRPGEVRNPQGLFATLISHAVMEQVRASLRRAEREKTWAASLGSETRGQSGERDNILAAIREEVAQLPECFRAPIVERFFEQQSYAEIARVLKCKTGTVGSRLERAIEKIRERLAARGFCLDSF